MNSKRRRLTFRLAAEERITAAAFLLPAVLVFTVVVVWPVIQSARYSLYSWNGLGPPSHFVGFYNYRQLLADPIFWKAVSNNALVLLWSLVVQIPLAVMLAILLTGRIRGLGFFRTVYFSPFVLSSVVVGLLWQWVYNPTFGLANSLLEAIGLAQLKSSWLGSESTVMVAIMVVSTWRDLGFFIVILVAAIQGIPEELYSAAKVDGASGWQLHRYVTLPLLRRTLLTTSVIATIGALQFFDLVWVLTGGGPYHSSEVLATYMFKMAFQLRDWGYATTLAFVLFCATFVIVVAFLSFMQSRKRLQIEETSL